MNNSLFRHRIILLLAVFLLCGVIHAGGQKGELVKTKWNRSDGMKAGDDIYFLSDYSLYIPGTVIVPMFVVTDPRYYYNDLSLYRMSPGEQDTLERVWSFGPEIAGKVVNLRNSRFGRKDEKLYFTWRTVFQKDKNESMLPVLEYDLNTRRSRILPEKELPVDLDYHPEDKIKRTEVWGRAGLLPLSQWELPSPLEYSSKNPGYLKKVILDLMGDRDFRAAAFKELDSRGNERILREILTKFESITDCDEDSDYISDNYGKWVVLIKMSETLRKDRPDDIFSAAFDNDTEALKGYLDAGADPNTTDSKGNTLLMYTVFGIAPDTMTMLFHRGADEKQQNDCGKFPWLYAALNPLRSRFLELSE